MNLFDCIIRSLIDRQESEKSIRKIGIFSIIICNGHRFDFVYPVSFIVLWNSVNKFKLVKTIEYTLFAKFLKSKISKVHNPPNSKTLLNNHHEKIISYNHCIAAFYYISIK